MDIQFRQTGKTQMQMDVLATPRRSWLQRWRVYWLRRRERHMWLKDLAERQAIAQAFNARYVAAERHDCSDDSPVKGDPGDCGIAIPQGNRWMCPTCNAVHAPLSNSVFSGLQYPACCVYATGPRTSGLGRYGYHLRPIGWYGPYGLFKRFLHAGLRAEPPSYATLDFIRKRFQERES